MIKFNNTVHFVCRVMVLESINGQDAH